jgi:murein DD-endopeptidase MepM/ murein hydrolase activator NlpD
MALAGALVVLSACPAPHRIAPAPAPVAPAPAADGEQEGTDTAGVVHVVRRGQTLYRIARTYGVDPADLMRTNGITDPRTLEVGQELFVPGATRVLDVPEAPGVPSPAPAPADPAAPRPARAGAEREEATAPPASPRPVLGWPLKGVLYGRFGARGGAHHDGIDIAAPEGSAVLAAADGTVIFVGRQSGYGNVVILRHENGLVTVYAHNSAVLVREGEQVTRGQPVARVGQTGRTTGPHLHFEVREGVKPRNPLLYLP